MNNIQWEGVFPALTTKFNQREELDIDSFERNLQIQLEAGVHGVILGGTLGESSVLEEFEKEMLTKKACELTSNKVPVILNIAEGSTKQAIRQAEMARLWGAQGLMLLPPMRYKTDNRETLHFFSEIARSTSLPIMIYNNPVDYKTEVSLDVLEELLQFDTIQAIKESTRDVSQVTRIRTRFGNRLKILCGVDTLAMESLLMGASGWVAGLVCAFPFETVRLYRLVREGRIDEARLLYQWFLPLLELDIHPKLVQYIKFCEAKMGLGSEYVRSPRLTIIGEERNRVEQIIDKALSNRPQAI